MRDLRVVLPFVFIPNHFPNTTSRKGNYFPLKLTFYREIESFLLILTYRTWEHGCPMSTKKLTLSQKVSWQQPRGGSEQATTQRVYDKWGLILESSPNDDSKQLSVLPTNSSSLSPFGPHLIVANSQLFLTTGGQCDSRLKYRANNGKNEQKKISG